MTIADLGILRDVTVAENGRVQVTITPTYSGCPAMDAIRDDVIRTLAEDGYPDATVATVLAPAWSTDRITEAGRDKLRAYGIAPPAAPGERGPVQVSLTRRPSEARVPCPQCGSAQTREVSRFGSTACKAQYVCRTCAEPFDYFKVL